MKKALTLTVNGEPRQLFVDPWQSLLEALRGGLGLLGTKEGCGNGNCGSCTVLLNGRPVNSCLVLALEAEGCQVTTIEGLAQGGKLTALQQAFIEYGAVQCGFCTPGLLLTAHSFLQSHPRPTEAEVRKAIAGNLCRCTGYDKVVQAILAVPITSGKSPPKKRASGKAIGERLPRVDGEARVTGRATFGADFNLPGTLYGKILRSPYPHARIKKIDTSAALAVEGVKAVITAADLPQMTPQAIAAGREAYLDVNYLRKMVLAEGKADFAGHAVAAVAATSSHIAAEAIKRIKVDYEELPLVDDVLEAMQPSSSLLHPDLYTQSLAGKSAAPSNIASVVQWQRGDVEAGFAKAEVVIEKTYRTEMVHQGYLEPQAATALVETGGKVTVWTSSQGHFNCQSQLSLILGIPLSNLKVVPMEIGGGFGGKSSALIEPLCILLSQRTGKPVQIVLTRDEVFRSTGPGSPVVITLRTGATRDGKLTALEGKFIYDSGCYPGAPVAMGALMGLAPYKVESFKMDGYAVVTNKPWVMPYRAPGATQAAFAVEVQMDIMAQALGIDPLELRRRNAVAQGDLLPTGNPFNRIGFQQLLEKVSQHPAWRQKLRGKNQGRGLACGFWMGAVLTSSAQLTLKGDGSIAVVTGSVDLTGTRTTMAQIAAEEFQIPVEKVSVSVGDTDSVGYTDLSAGSRTAYSTGAAVHRACQDALGQLRRRAAAHLELKEEDLEYSEGKFRSKASPSKQVSLEELAAASKRRGEGPVMGRGSVLRLQPAPAFAAHLVDVEVDPETGKVKLLNYTAFQDVGRAINPLLVEGQMQGGVAQGVGWALTEAYAFKEGVLQNPGLMDYRMLTARDLPSLATEIIEVPATDGPYGVRGVGEAPIVPPPAAISNAIYNAIGVRLTALPMTPEAVFLASKDGQKKL